MSSIVVIIQAALSSSLLQLGRAEILRAKVQKSPDVDYSSYLNGADRSNSGLAPNNHEADLKQSSKTRSDRAVYLALDNSTLFIKNREPSNAVFFQNDQPPVLDQCCACDEAKYELVFEGLWSRYTHPEDFPENYWLALFSDIIGASHSTEFRMWNPNTFATEGVRELAESGSTKKLESELKLVSSKTRTIIKARELRYPTLNSKTTAVFRTDRQHHLVSILSKLSPSPDWMVGVSGLELCQADCTWAVQKVINLNLWDAGTDSGSSFNASDMPTRPQEKIHPFKRAYNSSNSNQRLINSDLSNFNYSDTSNNQGRPDEYSSGHTSQVYGSESTASEAGQTIITSDQLKPFARLSITRQRIYEKSCNEEAPQSSYKTPQTSIQNVDPWYETTRPTYSDCRFTDWSDWSTCSSTCGKGIRTRTRSFLDQQAQQEGCSQVDLIEKEVCVSECSNNLVCVTSDWSPWSKCSVTCGQGLQKRTRMPIAPWDKQCHSVNLAEMEPCSGNECNTNTNNTKCEVEWSRWSECSVACGQGVRIRTRIVKNPKNCNTNETFTTTERSTQVTRSSQAPKTNRGFKHAKGNQSHTSLGLDDPERVQKEPCIGPRGSCGTNSKGQTGKSNPYLPVIDCKLSLWSPWSTCSALCGTGIRTRSRYIIQMPQNGGKSCDKKRSRTQKCKELPPCPTDSAHQNISFYQNLQQQQTQKQQQHSDRDQKKQSNSWRAPATTPAAAMMEDEDDITAEPILVEQTCKYGNWSQWSECEVVCQPVKKGSNKVRLKLPLQDHRGQCQVIEELYYCDPEIYC